METLYSTSSYLNNLLDTDSPLFCIYGIAHHIYPHELQLNRAYASDTKAPFLDKHLSVPTGLVSFKFYDKRDYFDFNILNCDFRW